MVVVQKKNNGKLKNIKPQITKKAIQLCIKMRNNDMLELVKKVAIDE